MSTRKPLTRLPGVVAKASEAVAKAIATVDTRDALILEAQESGASYAELADATGLTTWRVGQILKRERTNRQADANYEAFLGDTPAPAPTDQTPEFPVEF